MTFLINRRWKLPHFLGILLIVLLLGYGARMTWTLARCKSGWSILANHVSSVLFANPSAQGKHLIFVMVDHYEPGVGDRGEKVHAEWASSFLEVSNQHRDADGKSFQYTWFYPYDHKNENVLYALNQLVRDGYGEVELHWHHPSSDNTKFPGELAECLQWFHERGALLACGDPPHPQYAFIHGNWALDGSDPVCGVSREIEILQTAGCWGDFTFSTIGTAAQPSKLNSIYWVRDTPEPKSHDNGPNAEVGNLDPRGFLIFEGPTGIDWRVFRLEYGAVEDYALPTRARVRAWVNCGIQVTGQPEWLFVKVYSHGAQSRAAIVQKHLGSMLDELEAECQERGLALHYMTAREAYNVVRAAECGHGGDPNNYRDFELPPPVNRFFCPSEPVGISYCSPDSVACVPLGG